LTIFNDFEVIKFYFIFGTYLFEKNYFWYTKSLNSFFVGQAKSLNSSFFCSSKVIKFYYISTICFLKTLFVTKIKKPRKLSKLVEIVAISTQSSVLSVLFRSRVSYFLFIFSRFTPISILIVPMDQRGFRNTTGGNNRNGNGGGGGRGREREFQQQSSPGGGRGFTQQPQNRWQQRPIPPSSFTHGPSSTPAPITKPNPNNHQPPVQTRPQVQTHPLPGINFEFIFLFFIFFHFSTLMYVIDHKALIFCVQNMLNDVMRV